MALRFLNGASKLAILLLGAKQAIAAPAMLERRATVPSYVLSYAPLVWLYSGEQFFPSDIGAQLTHTHPSINFTTVASAPSPLTLSNLDQLNNLGGASIYLSSNDNFAANPIPAWLNGVKPDSTGKANGIVSTAIIVHDKGAGIVDAFYMYFYAYNQGNVVFGTEAGDHVGDWEHNMIRFSNGVPQAIWYSQHSGGEAFTYSAVQKNGIRPITYSAQGSHANYAISGTHDHTIPGLNLPVGVFLKDYTDQGTLWDPTLSAYVYSYTPVANAPGTFTAYNGQDPTPWLQFTGMWGDAELPSSDPRQHYFLGIELTAKYTGGPTGPEDKSLNRTNVCPDGSSSCIIRTILTAK